MSKQAALPLSWPDRYNIDNFIIADCNRTAFELIQHLEKWQGNVLLLQGPDFSGKTHLAHIFQNLHSGENFEVIDSADRLPIEKAEELFHLVNAAMLEQKKVLLTFRNAPKDWVKLPDLLSRLQAAQLVTLSQPDEEMIGAAYQKLFHDRGLLVDLKVLNYLAIRSQRSFADIQENVTRLDTASLEAGRKITIPLIQKTEII